MKTEPRLSGFSVLELCNLCSADNLCIEHYEQKEAILVNYAHSLVETNLVEQEGHSYHSAEGEASGHDWVGSTTRTQDGREREEFKQPSYDIADRISGYRFLGQHMIELRDEYDITLSLKVPRGYTICESCHYQYNKAVPCPNCN
jgi:hypothetical protein